MRIFITILILCAGKGWSQQLQVCSSRDSLPVPFATIYIKNSFLSFGKVADAKGKIEYHQAEDDDSSNYTLIIQAVGYDKLVKVITGIGLNKLKRIYITPSNLNLNEVVITAQYAPTATEQSVQKIQVIDKEKIQQMGAVNMRDVLSNQLNVRLQQDNVLGAGMSLQGISGENVKLLMDGVPMIGRLNGNIDLSQINVNNVERVEFIEGPLSVQYGTNALAGTINIITKNPGTKKLTLATTGYYESIGTYNISADANVHYKKHNIQINGGRNYFDGWNTMDHAFYFPKPQIADSSRYKKWKPKEQYFATLGYSYTFNKLNAGLKTSFFDEKITNRGYPRAPYAESSFDDYYYTRRFDNNAYLNGKISKNWTVNALAAYNYYSRIKKTVYKDLTTLDETLSLNNSDQDTSTFTLLMSRASFVHRIDSSRLNYEIGYDINYESAFGKRINNQLQYMGDYAGFATLEYKPIPKLIIKPGVRYAYNTLYKTPLIPSLNLKWTLNNKHTVRGSYARGFRAPALKELYFLFVDINHNIVGNMNLRSEQSDNFSVSYNYKTTINNCRFKLDVNAFYNDIYNLITLAQTTATEYSYINIGKYKTFGVQLNNTLKFKKLTFQTGFNYTGRYNDLSETQAVPQFNYSPEVSENIAYRLIKKKISISMFYKYNGKLPGYILVDNKVQQTSLSDYHTLDVTVSKLWYKDRIGITVGCKNMFDVKNINSTAVSGGVHSTSSSTVPLSTGRNYFIKLTLSLTKE
ncbi:MAG: TonB-dependent receptor [Bacteroidetes bacterium]|nr:TonB-dependent receptor [Bacteroidota bacterium]